MRPAKISAIAFHLITIAQMAIAQSLGLSGFMVYREFLSMSRLSYRMISTETANANDGSES